MRSESRLADPSRRHPPFEYRIHRPDGSEHWIRGNVFQCSHAETGETLLCGVAEDITAAKKHEADRAAAARGVRRRRQSSNARANRRSTRRCRREIDRRVEVERELLEKQAYLERLLRFQEWDRSLVSLEIHDGAIQNAVGSFAASRRRRRRTA